MSSNVWLLLAGVLLVAALVRPGATTLLLPALFAGLCWWRRDATAPVLEWPRNLAVRVGLLFFLAGIGLELLAWLGSYLTSDSQPYLMHPQLIPDLLLATGFYGGMALGWMTLLRWWEFSVRVAFITVGTWGLLNEQQGRAIVAIGEALSTVPLQASALALQVFAVYGAIGGTAHLVASRAGAAPSGRRAWLKYPAATAALTIGAYLSAGARPGACVAEGRHITRLLTLRQ